MAIIDFIEYVTTALDKKKHVMGIFIDLKKAFDTIDHEILMKKLYQYGLRGISQKWIQSNLLNMMKLNLVVKILFAEYLKAQF